MKITDLVTIVIPTHNRPDYLIRILDYFSGCELPVLVADSSEKKYPKLIPEGVKYYHIPEVGFGPKLRIVLGKVKTKYSVMCADDDFLIVDGIVELVKFLEKNPDYSVAKGHQVGFNQDSKEASFYPSNDHASFSMDINQPEILDRLCNYFKQYVPVFYGVHRTEIIRKAFEQVNVKSNPSLVELLTAAVPLVYGKLIILPIAYGATAVFSSVEISKLPLIPRFDDMVREQEQNVSYKEDLDQYFSILASEISKQDNIGIEEALVAAKSGMNAYLFEFLPTYYEFIAESYKVRAIKSIVRKLHFEPLLKPLYRSILFIVKRLKQTSVLYKAPSDIEHGFNKDTAKKELKRMKYYIDSYDVSHK
jgi:glycosyltransferase domain-containing protein